MSTAIRRIIASIYRTAQLPKAPTVSALALMMFCAASFSSDWEGAVIEEVTITARKRAEFLQDVPIAVTVFDKAIVADGNLDAMADFMEMVPNMALPGDGWTSADISIRGSGRISGDEDPGVGINRDGVYVGGLLTSFSNFYDIESFEVLRGPQAGLYGRNAVGGAININTTRPDFEQDGYLDLQLGNLQHQQYRGATNLTLIDDVMAIRVSGLYIDQDEGFDRIVNQGKYLDAHTNKSARLRVLYTPSNDLEFLSTLETFSATGNILNGVHAPHRTSAPLNNFLSEEGTDVDNTDYLAMNAPLINESDQLQFIQEVNWVLADGTLTGIFSYRDTESEISLDGDRTTHDLELITFDSNQESTFTEIRWAGTLRDLNITAGVTYLDENLTLDSGLTIAGAFGIDFAGWYTSGLIQPSILDPALPAMGLSIGDPISSLGWTNTLGNSGGWRGELGDAFPAIFTNDQKLESKAVFLEFSYPLNSNLDVWFNIRYTEDTKTIDFAQEFDTSCSIACDEVFTTFFGRSAVVGHEGKETWENVSPAIGIDYAVNENLMVYAKYVTGFKAGGFNSVASTPERVPFDSETTEAIEVGVKSQWWGDRLQVNTVAFYQERADAVVPIADPGLPNNFLGVNSGEIHIQGLELDLRLIPVEGLDISLSLGYLDAEFNKFESDGFDYSDNRTPLSYKYSVSGVVSYAYSLTKDNDFFTYISYYNAQDGYLHSANADHMDEPETVDLRMGIKAEEWKLSAFVDNVMDNRYLSFQSDAAFDQHWGIFVPGRTYGIQAVYRFQ